jgi:hypothetical protein
VTSVVIASVPSRRTAHMSLTGLVAAWAPA